MGGLLVLMLILLLLIVVVVVCVRRRAQGKTIQDTHSQGKLFVLLCVYCANLLLPLQLVEEQPTMTYHVRTTWCMVCVR